MAQFVNMHTVELTAGSAPKVPLGRTCIGDHLANRCGAFVTMEGITYPLGGNCAGTAILADGSTVPLTGTIAGNQAYVELDNACYQVEGQITVHVKWVYVTLETTLISFYGTVEITETGVVIQPSTPIPDLAQLMAQIAAMQEATAAANAAASKSVRYDTAQNLTDYEKYTGRGNIDAAHTTSIAPIFVLANDYSAGDVVIYQGDLIRFTQNHTGGTNPTVSEIETVSMNTLLNMTAVLYNKDQNRSDAEKTQARINIGAVQAAPTGDGTGYNDGLLIVYAF